MSRISTNRADAIRVVYSGRAKRRVAHHWMEYTRAISHPNGASPRLMTTVSRESPVTTDLNRWLVLSERRPAAIATLRIVKTDAPITVAVKLAARLQSAAGCRTSINRTWTTPATIAGRVTPA